jgi:hypothetical protein
VKGAVPDKRRLLFDVDFGPLIQIVGKFGKHKAVLKNAEELSKWYELRAAIIYEYARESITLQQLVQSSLSFSGHDRYDDSAIAKLKLIRFWNCILWPSYFPHTPWLKISPTDRAERIAAYLKTVRPRPAVKINDRRDWSRWQHAKPVPQRHGTKATITIKIDWAAGNDQEIVKHIADWVRASRPKNIREPRGDGFRENVNAALLKRLSTMRLLHHYPFKQARDFARESNIEFPGEHTDAAKARHAVRRDFHAIFHTQTFTDANVGATPLIPRNEDPIHFSSYRRRKWDSASR